MMIARCALADVSARSPHASQLKKEIQRTKEVQDAQRQKEASGSALEDCPPPDRVGPST